MSQRMLAVGAPVIAALLGVSVIVAWARVEPRVAIELRKPGRDRPVATTSAAAERPLVGRLSRFSGTPAEIKGSWPRFRGARFDGIADDGLPLARTWPGGGPPKLWTITLGEGHAGPAVQNGCVYVVDYDRAASSDAIRCFSLNDGREIWRFSYPDDVRRNHGMSRTVPALSEKYLLSIGPKCHVACLDPATGKQYFLKDMVKEFGSTVPPWYAGQCPIIDGENAILAPAGASLLVALRCATGEVVWKCPNPLGWTMTHVSVMPMDLDGRKTWIYCGSGGAAGVAADTGKLLWDTTAWNVKIAAVASPVVLPGNKIFFSGGYECGAAIMQIEKAADRYVAKLVRRLSPKEFGSTQHTPILYRDHLYGVREKDKQFVCMDLEGNTVWASGSAHKFGIGPYMLVNGLIYIVNDESVLTLVEATPDAYRQLAQATILPDSHDSWAPTAYVAGRLLMRDVSQMTCLEISAK